MKTFIKQVVLIILPAMLVTFSGQRNAAAAEIMVGWSAEQDAIWTQMVNENHPKWQDVVTRADSPTFYDHGIVDAFVYRMTGDTSYAQDSFEAISQFCGRTYVPPESTCTVYDGEPYSDDQTRALFPLYAKLYPLLKNALSAQQRAIYRDILDHWTDLTLNLTSRDFAPRRSDSDALSVHYLSLMLYALAIENEDPARSQEIMNFTNGDDIIVGGLDSTGVNRDTWRNCLSEYASRAKGGVWLESSQYNVGTMRFILNYVTDINRYLGVDKFPEITALIEDVKTSLIQEVTPDLRDSFQWSDTEEPHGLRLIYRPSIMATVSALTNDPVAYYLFDLFYDRHSSIPVFSMFTNPYNTPRMAPQDQYSFHYAPGRGIAYYHEGWQADDSYFASAMFSRVGVDHDVESLSNFGLYRNQHWAIDYPRGYSDSKEMDWLNGLVVHGGLPSTLEARGSIAAQSESDYVYHVGTTGGHVIRNGEWNPPPEALHEFTRSHLYVHNNDGSDTIVLFDRVNSTDPRTITNFDRYHPRYRSRVEHYNGKHQWILHTPTQNVNINGNKLSWIDNGGEEVALTTFMSNYDVNVFDETVMKSQGLFDGYPASTELKYQIRLVPQDTSEFQTYMNVIHVGSDAAIQKFDALSGESAEGVLINVNGEKNVAIFNGSHGPVVPPTPENGNYQVHDPDKFEKISAIRLFKAGFNVELPTADAVRIFVADLDTAQQWFANIDGEVVELQVSESGLAILNLSEQGANHQVSFYVTNSAPVAVISDTAINGLTVTLDGNLSTDPDGDEISYLWNFGDGSTSTDDIANHTYASSGEFEVSLTVNDGFLEDTETVFVQVGSNETPVMASIGDKYIVEENQLVFNVSAVDPNGDDITLTAVMDDGSSISTIGAGFTDHGNNTGTFNFTPSVGQAGSYIVVFRASDGSLSDMESIVITVSDGTITYEYHWLEAEFPDSIHGYLRLSDDDQASYDQYMFLPSGNYWTPSNIMATYVVNVAQEGNYKLFGRAIASGDLHDSFFIQIDNGSDNTWDIPWGTAWEWADVTHRGVEGATVFHLTAGQHTIKVKARENGTLLDKMVLTNNMDFVPAGLGDAAENAPETPNQSPVAVIGTPIVDGFNVQFYGSDSYDPDGDVLSYLWDFGNEQTSTEANPLIIFESAGVYLVTLTVSDGDLMDADTIEFTVEATNQAPVAIMAFPTVDGLSVQFDGTSSYDPDGNTVSYLWNFGDGDTSSLAQPSHVYASSGDYQVTLTVSDGDLEDVVSREIILNQAPTSIIGDVVVNGLTAAFDGSQSYDPDNDALNYLWDFGDGVQSTEENPVHEYTEAGDFTVTLIVSDGSLTGDDNKLITIDEPVMPEYHWLEVEYAENIQIPMRNFEDGTASSGMYAMMPNGSGNYWTPTSVMATLSVDIEKEGDYILWGRTIAPGDLDDSFYIQVDNGTNNLWDIPWHSAWNWDKVTHRGDEGYVTVHLSAGRHTINIKAREDGTKIDKILLTNDVNYVPSSLGETAENIPVYQQVVIEMEAEQYSTKTIPFVVVQNAEASGGQYIQGPNGSGDVWNPSHRMVTYVVTVPEAGEYVLFGRTIAPGDHDDSFFVQIDSGADQVWDIAWSDNWQWDAVNNRGVTDQVKFNLTAGTHTIKIKLREDGPKLDKMVLTNDLGYNPAGMGE